MSLDIINYMDESTLVHQLDPIKMGNIKIDLSPPVQDVQPIIKESICLCFVFNNKEYWIPKHYIQYANTVNLDLWSVPENDIHNIHDFDKGIKDNNVKL